MTAPLFISFEGIEGSGKSTQLRRLAASLVAAGQDVVCTREPGGTEVGDRVRAVLLDPALRGLTAQTEMLLFAASRAQHVAERILPALRSGSHVLCDRYLHSSLAYQAHARGLGRALVLGANAPAVNGCLPDLVLLFDLPVAVAFARARARGTLDRIEGAGEAFHEAVRSGFLAERALDPSRFVTVDARETEDQVFAAVHAAVQRAMALG